MKKEFLNRLINEGIVSLKRFPEVISLAIIGSFCSIYLIEHDHSSISTMPEIVNLMHTCMLGIGLLTGLKLLIERMDWSLMLKQSIRIAGLVFLLIYYLCLPKETTTQVVIRALLLGLTFHCFVAVAPYLKKSKQNGFWQFNRSIFLQILLSVLYSGVLYVGVALAMVAIDNLFGIHIKSNRYAELWVLLAGIFNTWFFLSGVPSDFEELEYDDEYPRGLKIFTQYVLLPLVGIYVLILYAYLLKITLTWKLPVGWVSILILSFSILGILSLLLVYPLREQDTDKWIKHLSRWFYRLLFPLIGLLFVAIGKRLSQYGITEERYFIVALALWLLGISIYFLISKKQSIRYIPISLGLLSLFASFGPWGSFSVSKHNQMSRLKHTLEKVHLIENGKIIKAKKPIPFDEHKKISSAITYLCEMHGYKSLQPFFKQNLDSAIKKSSRYEHPSIIVDLIGVKYLDRWEQNEAKSSYVSLYMKDEDQKVYEMDGYRYFVHLNNISLNSESEKTRSWTKFKVGKDSLMVDFDQKQSSIVFQFAGEESRIPIKTLMEKYSKLSNQSPEKEELTFNLQAKSYQLKLVLISLTANYTHSDDKTTVSNITAYCFFSPTNNE